VLLLSVRQIRRSLTPLERLQDGTRRLAQGDLDTRVEVTSGDEFQDLAASFNRMATQLGRQFKALEMRREISATLNPTQSTDEVLRACARVLTEHLTLAALGIWVVGPDGAAWRSCTCRATPTTRWGPAPRSCRSPSRRRPSRARCGPLWMR
jgi:HAMP domain-containing protein